MTPQIIHLALQQLPTTPQQSQQLYQQASDAEQARAKSFGSPKRRDEYLVGRWLGRTLAAALLGGSANDYAVTSTEAGPPELQRAVDVEPLAAAISISHSRSWVACVLQVQEHLPKAELGVDIESLQRNVRALAVAEHSFDPAEAEYLASLNTAAQKRAFTQLWTLKEASLKATGIGIAKGLKQPAFATQHPDTWQCVIPVSAESMSYLLLECVDPTADECYSVAIAASESATPVAIFQLSSSGDLAELATLPLFTSEQPQVHGISLQSSV